jgi:hypothetical protein
MCVCVHSSLMWIEHMNIFSKEKHILSQRALPYHSYAYTNAKAPKFHWKFRICGKNYRFDQVIRLLQAVNQSIKLAHALYGHFRHLLFCPPSSLFNRKKMRGDTVDWITLVKACLLVTFSVISTSCRRLQYKVETELPHQEFLCSRMWISLKFWLFKILFHL